MRLKSSVQAARGLRTRWVLVQRFARPGATLIDCRAGALAFFSGAQAARGLRAPWALVQRCARPGATLIDCRWIE